MLEQWAVAGLPPTEFWACTLREVAVVLKGAAERRWNDHRLEQALSYTLAKLVGFAVNQPKDMPKFEKVFPDGKPPVTQSADEIHDLMLAWVQAATAAAEGDDGR